MCSNGSLAGRIGILEGKVFDKDTNGLTFTYQTFGCIAQMVDEITISPIRFLVDFHQGGGGRSFSGEASPCLEASSLYLRQEIRGKLSLFFIGITRTLPEELIFCPGFRGGSLCIMMGGFPTIFNIVSLSQNIITST